MSIGRVFGGALRSLRRGRLILIGMAVAVMGLVYALLDAVLRTYNKDYLSELGNTLSTNVPANFGWLLLLAIIVAVVGGLLAEGELIVGAGSRAANALLSNSGGGPSGSRAATGRDVLKRLPQLIAVGLLVWWKLLLALAVVFAPALYAVLAGQSDSTGWALALLGSACISGLLLLGGWFWYWPQQRLANCALLLEGLPPRAAVRTGRSLYRGNLGNALGFWLVLLLLNFGLVVVSLLLAGLGAGLVSAVWSQLNGVEERTAFVITAVVALLAGLVLLVWDGAVSAFNLNAWVLAYFDLRGGTRNALTLQHHSGTTQVLGRQRDTTLQAFE